MELSKRLQAVADLVKDSNTVADVGTDHGYIPIYLVRTNKCKRAIAMDINKGPLLRAQEHINAYHLEECIETRLSDGVCNLKPGECDCVVIAGMGGALITRILEEGKEVFHSLREFVLAPQSELSKVRQYLYENEYCIVEENMVLDESKFYTMFRVVNTVMEEYNKVEMQYGKLLLEQQNEVLKAFLLKEQSVKEMILAGLNQQIGSHIETRKKEIEIELEDIQYALQRYYKCD